MRRVKIDRREQPPTPTPSIGSQLSLSEFGTRTTPERAKSKRPKVLERRRWDQMLEEVREMQRAAVEDRSQWTRFEPRHFVILYALLHGHVYKALPEEVRNDWYPACASATRMLKNDFNGNPVDMVVFVRWVWDREEKQLPTRNSDFRIGWRYMFGPKLLTDYRIAAQRRARHRR